MHDTDDAGAENARLEQIRAELIDTDRAIAGVEARRLRLEAEAALIAAARTSRVTRGNSRAREMALRSIALELAAPLRISDRTMQTRLGDAEQLCRLFPTTIEALGEGRLSRGHAMAVLDAGVRISDPDVRAAYERVVIDWAASETAARTRAFARRLAEQLDPRSIDERFAEANEARLVTAREIGDGMAEVVARLPVDRAFGILDRLTRQAQTIEAADTAERRAYRDAVATAIAEADARADAGRFGDASRGDARESAVAAVETPWFDERTRDQIRADLFADLLLTGAPAIDTTTGDGPGLGAIRAQVQLTVPVSTLTGVTVGGAELDGRAAVDTETARRLAGDAPGWDRVFTDPVTGTVLEVDRYEPFAAQRRFLRARDVHCRTMGCRRPARHHQLDHNLEHHEGGPTRLDNLAGFCVRHHTLKTETEWTVRQLPGGTLEWTSPLGHAYRERPPTRVVFTAAADPPPF
jgi:hypothetical protein